MLHCSTIHIRCSAASTRSSDRAAHSLATGPSRWFMALRLRDFDFGWTLPSGATVIFPTTDSVLPFPGLPGASSGIGGVTSVVPTSGVLPTSGLSGVSSGIGGVTSVLPASGVLPTSGPPGVTDIQPSTTLGSISVPGVTGVPTSGRSSGGALPSDSGLLSARPLPPQ
ncbi:hypothetical protein OC844_007819 [Tilletia horrida]|nr:hypothetical protein OC844_007819 [Tilletia horrida]